jgi:integrase
MAGLRSSEILALRWDAVVGRTLRIGASVSREDLVKPPKSAASVRVVPIPEQLATALEALERIGPFVVRGELSREQRLSVQALQSWLYARVKAAAKKVGVQAGPHTLRHTWASVLVAAGTPIPWVAKWAGHKDLASTFRVYGGHLPPETTGPLDALAAAISEVSTSVHTPATAGHGSLDG